MFWRSSAKPLEIDWAERRRAAAHAAASAIPPNYKAYHAHTAASHLDIRGKSILVVGCNRGEDCEVFVDLGARSVCGLDVMDEVGANYQNPKVRYLLASAEDIPAETASFDMVFAYATLEHVPNIDPAFKQMARVCAPGGIVYSAAAPLWNSRQGPHWGDAFNAFPWPHLRLSPAEIHALNLKRESPFSAAQIDYWLDDRNFNKRFAREYLAAGWSIPGVEIISNELQQQSPDGVPDDVFSELAAKGYSRMELLALTHILLARKL